MTHAVSGVESDLLELVYSSENGNKVGVLSIHTCDDVHVASRESAVHGKEKASTPQS